MMSELSAEASAFGIVVEDALTTAGGAALARRADTDPSVRAEVASVLDTLGAWQLEPTEGIEQLEAAAVTCRAAGRAVVPYPVAERLVAGADRTEADAHAVALVDPSVARVDHADLDLHWLVTDGQGRIAEVRRVGPRSWGRLGRYVCAVELGDWRDAAADPGPLLSMLRSWTLLGMLEAASNATYRYVRERVQFGQTLAEFQSVQFSLTDVAVAVDALAELAKYTLWSVASGPEYAAQDALALRLAALEAADITFRAGHQLHGAIGFCDETPISWMSRLSQPLRRLPYSRTETDVRLVASMERLPFAGPFAPATPTRADIATPNADTRPPAEEHDWSRPR